MNFQSPSAFAKLRRDKQPKAQSPKPETGRVSGFGRWTLDSRLRPSNFGDRDGVALVITLIMLSIITFMAVTFLVLSQRERSSVNTAMDQKTARNASDAGLARVSAELLTRLMLQTNFQDMDLLTSTNYVNLIGLHGGVPSQLSPTNVNYDYEDDAAHSPLSSQDHNINIASLMFNPRPPVYVTTNAGTGQAEFRYYLDLNRNGRFDKNGGWPVVVTDNAGVPRYLGTNGALISTNLPIASGTVLVTNLFAGDPEWIGVLERPEELHSVDNRFIARYAYLVVPVGKTLDINTIHNQAVTRSLVAANNDGYLRNQGVGPWEINLAAFLADLNTNIWDANPLTPALYYQYNRGNPNLLPLSTIPNQGLAFEDAFSILSYRYNNDYRSLANGLQSFPFATILSADNIDEYSDGPLMTDTFIVNETTPGLPGPDPVKQAWLGAENTNHYFSSQDLFDKGKTSFGMLTPGGFSARLQQVGGSNDSYNAYTFYRMLAQLGTDSTADQTKLNVNFKNTDIHGNIIPGVETNLIPWTPLDFFTNAATAMFRQMNLRDFNGNLVTITNIPVYEDLVLSGRTNNLNYYTPAVHRVLQLAANMYDATTNRFIGTGPTNYPSVFRPIFRSDAGVAYIVGYQEVTDPNDAFLPFLDPKAFATVSQPVNKTVNLYGVPWVIGAKKGMPNFNEFSMQNALAVTRKLQFTNAPNQHPVRWQTNQIFDFSITNDFGIEAWNSYTNTYGRALQLVVSNEVSINLTNETGFTLLTVSNLPFGTITNFTGWSGWTMNSSLTDNSFHVPLQVESQFTNGIYGKTFVKPLNPPVWTAAFVPRIWMVLESKIRYVLIDTTANRVIDFVNIDNVQPPIDVATTLQNGYTGVFPDYTSPFAMWDIRLHNGIEQGILDQIEISKNAASPVWTDPKKTIQSGTFNNNLMGNPGGTNDFQAPYDPPATIYQRVSLEANDPLVHYTSPDMTSTNGSAQASYNTVDLNAKNPPLATIGSLNYSYQPWGGRHVPQGSDQNPNSYSTDWRVKDVMEQSDNWDFPTNKLPNIGWLGRVHRGTPWQTVYLKSSDLSPDDWTKWSNDNVGLTNGNNIIVDSFMSRPTDDYRLFDLFTSAISDTAMRGGLNVNQTNLAAWSAILSGVNVLSNSSPGPLSMVINPAGIYNPTNPSPVAAIVQAINATRANTNAAKGALIVFQNHTFQHAGDVLATPQLSIASPFLNTNGLANVKSALTINDEIIERIPQQIMSLLTLNQTPRFVIYSFGQTLHPADKSLVAGGTFSGLCTNYQITAESAVRAVVRVEGTSDPKFVGGKVDTLGRSYPPHLVVEQFNVLGPD